MKWLTEKEYTKAFGYGLSLLFIFALIMITCIGLFIASVGDGSMEIAVPDGEKVLQTVVYSNPLIIGLFALCLGLFVLDKKVRSIVSIAASLCGFSGLLLGVIVTQDGHSEMYFTMSAFVPCLLFAAEILDRYEWKHIVAKRTVAKGKSRFSSERKMICIYCSPWFWLCKRKTSVPPLQNIQRTNWF